MNYYSFLSFSQVLPLLCVPVASYLVQVTIHSDDPAVDSSLHFLPGPVICPSVSQSAILKTLRGWLLPCLKPFDGSPLPSNKIHFPDPAV